MIALRFALLIALWSSPVLAGESFDQLLDDFGRQLRLSTEDGRFRARLSGTVDLELYAFDQRPPDLIQTAGSWAFQPRTTLFLDVQAGPRIYAFAQARLDRGFDPSDSALRGRIDEYAIRLSPWSDGRLNLQAGQFATIVGQWVKRHLSWDNPLITAPLFYERVTPISDQRVNTSDYMGSTYAYNPIIWGPGYTTGFAASGRWRTFEWALEFKNAALLSRPDNWSWNENRFDHPTLGARLAWRPDLRWTFALSVSRGIYPGPDAIDALPSSTDPDDYVQTVFLADFSYAHRHLRIWGEWVFAEFEAPYAETFRTSAYFIEAEYTFAPRLSGAVRWNQQFSHTSTSLYEGPPHPREADASRLDLAVTWRFNAHSQIQFETNSYFGDASPGGFVWATRFTLRF